MKRTAITVLVTLLVIFGIYRFGFSKGWGERDAEMQSEIAIKNEESRAREQKLGEQLNQTSTELKDANDSINQKQSALDRAISAGRVRLPSSSCVQASAGSTTPSRNSQAGSESDRQTLELIAQIAADGDRAILQLNACVDAYNSVRSQVNDQR
jgi:flagellar capping protein FliD